MLTTQDLDTVQNYVNDHISNNAKQDPTELLERIRRMTRYITDLTPGCVKTTKDIMVSQLVVSSQDSKPTSGVGSQSWTDRWLNLETLETEVREGTKKCEGCTDGQSLSVIQDASVVAAAKELFLRALWVSLESAHNRTKREPSRHGTSMEDLWASPVEGRLPYADVDVPLIMVEEPDQDMEGGW